MQRHHQAEANQSTIILAWSEIGPAEILLGLALVVLFTVASAKLKILTRGGVIAALIVGALVTLAGGLPWLSLLLAFHVAAGALTRFDYEAKFQKGAAELKGGARSWTNVFANGSVAALFSLFQLTQGGGIFFGGFLGALSSAASDTLATEVGTLYPGQPRLITKVSRKVKAGTSGALSPYGEAAIFCGGGLMGSIAYILGIEGWALTKMLLIAVTAGFVGSTVDSIIGATLQAKYLCPRCSEETEANRHRCGSECKLVSGNRLLNNHSVNLVSTIVGSIIGVALAAFL